MNHLNFSKKLFLIFSFIGMSAVLMDEAGIAKAEPLSVAAVQSCELRAYVIDTDPKGLHVRARAGSSAPIAAVIPRDPDGTLVEIRGNVGDWLMMTHAETMGGK